MSLQPVLFVSHGAPDLAIADAPASRYLRQLGSRLARPSAILVVSAHHEADAPELTGAARLDTIHDFGGFDSRLAAMSYPAPGAPELAEAIAGKLREIGLTATIHPTRGLDHGAWVPLSLMFPNADVPVLSLSISPDRDAAWHARLGSTLAPLRDEGVLIIGSGSATHDLRAVFRERHPTPPAWVTDFADWLAAQMEAGDREAILAAVDRGPHGHRNHPTPDHILPLFAALGAAGPDAGRVLHRSIDRAVLAMDVYGWGDAGVLARLVEQRTVAPLAA